MHSLKTILSIAIFASASQVAYGGDGGNSSEKKDVPKLRKKPKSGRLRQIVEDLNLEALEPAPAVSDELFELGQALAFDKILSGNQNISCMSCHHPDLATGDGRHLPLGQGGVGLGPLREGGHMIPRNAPSMFNLHLSDTMFWDSRVSQNNSGDFMTPAGTELTPEMQDVLSFGVTAAQAMFPVTSNEEMRGFPGENELADAMSNTEIWERLMDRLGAIPEYVEMFELAYPGTDFEDMSFAHAGNAIAGFEIRAFSLVDSPWNQFLEGDDNSLTKLQTNGALEFFETGCNTCHTGSRLSDFDHHNDGLAQFGPGKGDGVGGIDDFGHERVSGDPVDRYRFRTPSLLNVALTGPWGHDGQFKDLKKYVQHYDKPVKSLEKYKIKPNVVEKALYGTQVDNVSAVSSTIDQEIHDLEKVNAPSILRFLEALSDPQAQNLSSTVPETVPSGLPVAD